MHAESKQTSHTRMPMPPTLNPATDLWRKLCTLFNVQMWFRCSDVQTLFRCSDVQMCTLFRCSQLGQRPTIWACSVRLKGQPGV